MKSRENNAELNEYIDSLFKKVKRFNSEKYVNAFLKRLKITRMHR